MREEERLECLDSIRGIAAFVVVLHHCWLYSGEMHSVTGVANPILKFFIHCLEKILWSGHAAVMVFFVLSGFVLAYSLQKTPTSYIGYLLKRIFRIYPAFLFIILVSYVLHYIIGVQNSAVPEWFKDKINPDLGLNTLLRNLALWGTTGSNDFDVVIWSLVHEMRISLIFPFILLSVQKYTWRSVIVYWLFSFVCTFLILRITGGVITGYQEKTFATSFLDTGFFIVFFAAGAYLAIERKRVAAKILAWPRWVKLFFFLVVLYLVFKSGVAPHMVWGNLADYTHGIGTIGLIGLMLGAKKFGAALSHGILVWLGRISYSLYLVHLPILYAISQTIGANWSVLQTDIVLVVSSLAAAELMARFIEFPSIKLGKRLCAKLP